MTGTNDEKYLTITMHNNKVSHIINIITLYKHTISNLLPYTYHGNTYQQGSKLLRTYDTYEIGNYKISKILGFLYSSVSFTYVQILVTFTKVINTHYGIYMYVCIKLFKFPQDDDIQI